MTQATTVSGMSAAASSVSQSGRQQLSGLSTVLNASFNLEGALTQYFNDKNNLLKSKKPNTIDELNTHIISLKKLRDKLGLQDHISDEAIIKDAIFSYAKSPNAEVDAFSFNNVTLDCSGVLSKSRFELFYGIDFQAADMKRQVKGADDFITRLEDLKHDRLDSKHLHFHFSALKDAIVIAKQMKKMKKSERIESGVLREYKPIQATVDERKASKYTYLAGYFRRNFMEQFSTDHYFDGRLFRNTQAFVGGGGYISHVNLSTAIVRSTITYNLDLIKRPKDRARAKEKYAAELEVRNNIIHLADFLEALNAGAKSKSELRSLSLKGNVLTSIDVEALSKLISNSAIELLDLSEVSMPRDSIKLLADAIGKCHSLKYVDGSALTSYVFVTSGVACASKSNRSNDYLSDEENCLLLKSFLASSNNLVELNWNGGTAKTSGHASSKSTPVILEIIAKSSALERMSFENQKLDGEKCIAQVYVMLLQNKRVVACSFDGSQSFNLAMITRFCVSRSILVPLPVSDDTYKGVQDIAKENSRTAVTAGRFEAVTKMYSKFRGDVDEQNRKSQQKSVADAALDNERKAKQALEQKRQSDELHAKQVEVATARAGGGGSAKISVVVSPHITVNPSVIGNQTNHKSVTKVAKLSAAQKDRPTVSFSPDHGQAAMQEPSAPPAPEPSDSGSNLPVGALRSALFSRPPQPVPGSSVQQVLENLLRHQAGESSEDHGKGLSSSLRFG